MKTTKIYTQTTPFNSDSLTPVGLYLSLRDKHRYPCLLESNDYHARSDSKSFIGLDPLISIEIYTSFISVNSDETYKTFNYSKASEALELIDKIKASYLFEHTHELNGFLSYFSFEYAHLVEGKIPASNEFGLPLAQFILFDKIIVLDHFRDTGLFIQNQVNQKPEDVNLNDFLQQAHTSSLPFTCVGSERSSMTEADFSKLVLKAKEQINRGNAFQLVVSRQFTQAFFGDDFEVFRSLRRLNPSPYLFYLDFEKFRLFGSSPETQIALNNGLAEIHPIAGTIKKSGDLITDSKAIHGLQLDEKENAEHTMLVDLARNDLSKFSEDVRITRYKEIQHFSHVIHLVSKVVAKTSAKPLELFNATFPAGTLSGTPKPKALELIEQFEPHPRGFYGGALGFITSKGNVNLAIIIRSALSQNNQLYYQAGAGIVLDSIPEQEATEVQNKLGALRGAILQSQNTLS